MSFLNILSFLATHPLGGRGAIGRFFRWQVASRLLPGPFIIPFVGGTSLVVERGMTGATGNYYCGLHEFEDMAFVLHALRPGDLFVDVGANIGSYSILAASTGASVIAFEPVPATFQRLERNIHFNRFSELIDARNEGVAAKPGSLPFTVGLDTVNHVLRPGESGTAVDLPVVTLDDALASRQPVVVKIDVEGLETEVLAGAERLISGKEPIALIVEMNGSGAVYGHSDARVLERLRERGFSPCRYDPFNRQICPLQADQSERAIQGNLLLIRSVAEFQRRTETAPVRSVGTRLL